MIILILGGKCHARSRKRRPCPIHAESTCRKIPSTFSFYPSVRR